MNNIAKFFVSTASLMLISACSTTTPETENPSPTQSKNFEECVAAGNPVMESYPRQCRDGENLFVEVIDIKPLPEEVNPDAPDADLKETCLSFDGNWLSESNECEGISKQMCEELGGTYNECASACRNDPEAEICTIQCVFVCQF